jgi:DNA-binding NtrC family response regulator
MAAAAYDVVVLEAQFPGLNADDLLEQLVSLRSGAPIVVSDPAASLGDGIRYVRIGAFDVAGAGEDLDAKIDAAAELRRGRQAAAGNEPWRQILVGSSPAMLRTAEIIRLVGGRRTTVLVTGETGSGKEMVARAIHMASPRAQLSMVTVNAAALPENLLEAELFGHVKGAFTGAMQQRIGRFEQANRSTLFLDEIGDLPFDIQTKLLRFLQEREFQRVGSSETIRVDVRLIAATNVDLAQRIREGRFREDLYYRLNVVSISAPPLRERCGDIPLLAQHFVEKICRQEEIPLRQLTPETLARLKSQPWPGNVRQLENAIEMAIAMSGDREILYPSDFALTQPAVPLPALDTEDGIALPEAGLDFEATVGRIERRILEEALRRAGGNKTAAAGMLGLKRTTLSAKLRSLSVGAG